MAMKSLLKALWPASMKSAPRAASPGWFGAPMTGGAPTLHLPKGATLSPKGDLGAHRVEEAKAASRKLKQGKGEKASSHLPYRPESMEIESKFGPGDKVV